jgi:hypothetical protein
MWWKRILFTAFISVLATPATAQIAPPPNYWARGTELGVTVGGATSTSVSGPMVALRIGWDITRRVSIDGRGLWIDQKGKQDSSNYGAALNGILNLVSKQRITPFVGGGFGLYRPTSSNQPAFSGIAGLDIIAVQHWSIRPEVSMLFPRGDGPHETVFAAGLGISYRFEDHLVTP